jgi:hypothetical protein
MSTRVKSCLPSTSSGQAWVMIDGRGRQQSRAFEGVAMGTQLAVAPLQDRRGLAGPAHRAIVAIDLEGSTLRTNPVKGELRRIMYDLLGRALEAAAINEDHLEQLTDRGDGVLVLIRPHDDVPKTVLGRAHVKTDDVACLGAEHRVDAQLPHLAQLGFSLKICQIRETDDCDRPIIDLFDQWVSSPGPFSGRSRVTTTSTCLPVIFCGASCRGASAKPRRAGASGSCCAEPARAADHGGTQPPRPWPGRSVLGGLGAGVHGGGWSGVPVGELERGPVASGSAA